MFVTEWRDSLAPVRHARAYSRHAKLVEFWHQTFAFGNGVDDCIRARSCREPVRKRHVEYDIYQHIPARYEQRTTYTDTLLHDRRA